jgi:protoporphyrinogen oxidase
LDNQRAGSTFNVQRSTSSDAVRPKNFEEWILSTFGKGIAKHFMLPYNRKIWSTDPSEMGCQWLGDRVPVVDVERVKRNIEQGVDDVSWGPNATFQFPKKGGTGAIWEALGRRIPEDNVRLGCKIVAVDPVKKEVKLDDGSTDTYDYLISTVPIPRLTEMAGLSALTETADKLRYTHVYVACIAPHFPIPEHLDGKTWIYCPEQEAVFYRVTPFSIFSPAHVPDISQYCSFLCEISRPGTEPLQDAASFIDPTMNDMRTIGLLDCDPENTHTYPMVAEFGYPVPTLNRDTLLNQLIPALEEKSIFSRGRFGGWKYEAANMDHSVMQGVEAVERILQDKEEVTWARPNVVNAGKR